MEWNTGFSSLFYLYLRHMHSTQSHQLCLSLGEFILNEAGVGAGDDMWALFVSNH